MSEAMMIFPEDVVLKQVNMLLYEVTDHTGRKYHIKDERLARYESCTHLHCNVCGKPVRKPRTLCDACIMESVSVWDGEYPIFIGDQFFENADDLIDWLYDHNVTREELLAEADLYKALPNMASEIVVCYDDLLAEDQELPKDIQECIDEFNRKLVEFKEPISWYADAHVKFTREQVDALLPEA